MQESLRKRLKVLHTFETASEEAIKNSTLLFDQYLLTKEEPSDYENIYEELLDCLIDELELWEMAEMDRYQAGCLGLAWLLKTQLYMLSETSRTLMESVQRALGHELDGCCEFLKGEG